MAAAFQDMLVRFGLKDKVYIFSSLSRYLLIVFQILSFNADNATSNDAQTTSLASRDNSFEEASCPLF